MNFASDYNVGPLRRELFQFGLAGVAALTFYWISRRFPAVRSVIFPSKKSVEPPPKNQPGAELKSIQSSWKLLENHHIQGEAELVRIMHPDDANPAGNVHGGTILRLIEEVGWVVASRHANSAGETGFVAATARFEQMNFHEPVYIGELIVMKAKLAFASKRSMMVVVNVHAENVAKQTQRLTNSAILWYVATKPAGDHSNALMSEIPPFIPNTEEEKRIAQRGKELYERRKEQERLRIQEGTESLDDPIFDPANCPPGENARKVSDSQSELAQLMLPSDCLVTKVVRGGVIMKLMDSAAGCVAFRHCRTNVVTVSLEAMDFKAPVFNGDLITIRARATFVSQKSMEIEVVVEAENLFTQTKVVSNTALFKFVSLDPNRKTLNIPPLHLETREEVQRFLKGKKRYEEQKKTRT